MIKTPESVRSQLSCLRGSSQSGKRHASSRERAAPSSDCTTALTVLESMALVVFYWSAEAWLISCTGKSLLRQHAAHLPLSEAAVGRLRVACSCE